MELTPPAALGRSATAPPQPQHDSHQARDADSCKCTSEIGHVGLVGLEPTTSPSLGLGCVSVQPLLRGSDSNTTKMRGHSEVATRSALLSPWSSA